MNVIFGVIGAVIGAIVAFVIQAVLMKKKTDKVLNDAEKEGERIKKDKVFQAKERFLKLKEEHEVKIKDRERKLQSTEDRVKNKEASLSKQIENATRSEK
ncbi:MAG: Rnase Y domain-containing protein, partial [Flavobacteriales bacterium]